MSDRYPPYDGSRVPVARAVLDRGGSVAGRLLAGTRLALRDGSGEVVLASVHPAGAGPGDWVAGRLVPDSDGRHHLVDTVVHAPCVSGAPDVALVARLPALELRARMVAAARAWFRDRGFLEVETPTRVRNPGLEPHLRAFPAGGEGRMWLATSPELHLKRLLAAGAERIVEFARAFRDDERGPWHLPEFTIVEWYRAWEGLDALERDCESLLSGIADAAGTSARNDCDLRAPFRRTTVRAEVADRAGIDLRATGHRDDLAREVERRGHPIAEDDDWDTVFYRLWIAEIEPHLGRDRPVFVHGYPASQAALARIGDDHGFAIAERFELYVDGIEVANAFHELNDPEEQRRRHEADRAARAAADAPVHELDQRFLGALASGMPPASGIAVGLDRLIALVGRFDGIAAVTAFPEPEP